MIGGGPAGQSVSSTMTWRVVRALGGSLLRLTRASADYVHAAPSAPSLTASCDEDTGEWPAPDTRDPGGP